MRTTFKIIVSVVLVLSLSGCIVVAALGVGAVGGYAYKHSQDQEKSSGKN